MGNRPSDSDATRRLAQRLNIVPIALFGLWLGPLFLFWLELLEPLRPFDRPQPHLSPWPWLAASFAGAAAVYKLPASLYGAPSSAVQSWLRRLGVSGFRRFVSDGDWINRAVRRRHPGYTVHRGDLDRALAAGRTAERSHLVCFAAGLPTTLFALALGWLDWAAWTGATNLLVNLYPALLQRLTRARLLRLTSRRPR